MHSAEGIGGNEKISLSDVLNSIDKGKFAAPPSHDDKPQAKKSKETTINTGKLRNQMKALKKEVDRAPALDKPVSGRKQVKMLREENYKINSAKLGKFIPQV